MAPSASAKQKTFRRARLGVASLIAISLAAGAATFVGYTPTGRHIELLAADHLFRRANSLPTEPLGRESVPVTVIGIDDSALARFGHWPWPWTRLADVATVLHECGARLIVFDIEFLEADRPLVIDRKDADGKPVREIVDTVPIFAESLRACGCAILSFPAYFKDAPDAEQRSVTLKEAQSPEERQAHAEALAVLLQRHAIPFLAQAAARLPEIADVQPILAPLSRAAAGAGYSSVNRDPDGVVRRVPLRGRYKDKFVFPHLMLEAAGFWRFGPDYQVALVGNSVAISSADGQESVIVPTSDAGEVELRWPTHVEALTRISAKPVLGLAPWGEYRRVMRRLDKTFPDAGWAAASRRLDEAYIRLVHAAPGAPSAAEIARMEKALEAIEESLAMKVVELARDPPAPDAQPPISQEAARRCLESIKTYDDEKVEQDNDLAELRQYVTGRLCVFGFHGTGFDLQTTPIGKEQPGVTVYPSGIRTILSGVAFRHLARWQEWLTAVLAAWLTGIATVHLSTWRGAVAAAAVSVLIGVVAWIASSEAALLLPVAGPVLAVLVAYAGVATYQQLTEASSRRWITRVFQQYNSADLVEEIVRNPDSLRLGGEVRQVTILFSDIAGFTPLSEKLAPERLVALLNRYLSVMTTLFQGEKGSLDKYQGDGIMAFFGAPVALPDHALRAVRAALAMHAALPQVNRELAGAGLLPEGATLAMRIGLSTGPAVVGNFGSEQRFNYTCSGDTVNLGARLEEANRWLGTRILVPEPTRVACGPAVLFRPLGSAKIRGKANPLVLYEPLALEPAPDDLRRLAEAFGRAIDALQSGDLASADAALAEVLALRPDDPPAQALKARLSAVKADEAAPQEPWNLTKSK